MAVKNLIPSTRKLTFSMIILSLVAFFFIGYYLYYLPANRDILHKNGFLILQKIQQNIKDRNAYLETSFINILKERNDGDLQKTTPQLQKQLDNYKIGGKIFRGKDNVTTLSARVRRSTRDTAWIDEDSTVYLADINKDSLFYKRSNSKNGSYQVFVPVEKFIEPLLTYQKTELFESYLLIGSGTGLVYIDPGLAINSGIAEDSLIAKNSKALFAGTKDINISGIKYKMFYYPFNLGPEHFQLCGFLKTDTYFNKLQQVPVAFIYPIVIALILIIMLLPILKFFLIGKDEHIKYADFIFGMISFFAGTAMLTLIIIQVLLLWAADLRTGKYLRALSKQIDNSFTQELTRAYNQLNGLDRLIKSIPDSTRARQIREHKNYNVSDSIKKYFVQCKNDPACYYNFNRVSWINEKGDQLIKGDIDTADPVFTNVAARSYFKNVKNNEGYPLPGSPGSRCVLEPVNSWTNGDFSIIISKKSLLGNESVVTFSTQMPSVMQTVLPPGFGFCIIDNDGKVMLHSDMTRNLQENFIAKTDPARQIKEAVKSRQESFFSSLNLYGKNNSLFIKPIGTTPFHLATFYDNGYIVPVNMRIFTFSLLFCCISSAICILLWFGVFSRRTSHNPSLYEPMSYLKWVVPKEKNVRFYVLSIFFLLIYLLLQGLMVFTSKFFEISNYTILILVFLLPVNIFSGLFVINYRVKRNSSPDVGAARKKLNPNKTLAVLFLQPAAVLFAYWYSASAGYQVQHAFLLFELFFFSFLCLFFLLPKGTFHFLYKSSVSYLSFYCWFSTLLLVCLCVLPASIYTWYAHNQEITQSIKKEQLYLANALRQRAAQTLLYTQKRAALGPPSDYFERLQYQSGIYKIYNDSINPDVQMQTGKEQEESYEKFYFSVANDIGNNYYDPLLIPALRDRATDNAWYWSPEKDSLLNFWYTLYSNPVKKDSIQNAGTALKITSAYPLRYEFVVLSFKGLLLLFFVAGFVYGLYLLLRFTSDRLFLRKFIPGPQENNNNFPANGILALFEEYKIFQEEWGTSTGALKEADIDEMFKEYELFEPVENRKRIYEQETKMIVIQDKYRDFYFFIWDKCTPKEKYLLLDFAQNGFVNFKNTEVIYRLLKKGILIVLSEEVKLFSSGFRFFILAQKQSKEMVRLRKEFQKGSAWQTIRIPLLIILLGVAFFVFFTQEQTFQKITALVAGVSTIVSLLLKFFSDGSNLFSAKK